MFSDDYKLVMESAKSKQLFLKANPLGFFVASIMAGMFVGLGIMLIFSIGGLLVGAPYAKIIMGASFGIALSLVIMAGSELFTGNNFIMAAGLLGKRVSWSAVLKVFILSYLGNWLGSIILAGLFYGAGLAGGPVGEFIASSAEAKMSIPFWSLLIRGILCNMLVCLAVWTSFRMKSESGKLIMIFWCLFAFITTGYEHSIANMSLLTVSLLAPFETAVSLGGYFYNILVASLGNMIGGIVGIGIPYYIISKKGY
ncbi:MAG: formate/nitrite transporter family protein [Clostridiales bacterium]|nr:formate/nitrite transporter family protein [Clostridiales bacterium]